MMRRLSRIYEPIADSAIGRIAGQHQSSYVCRRCLQRNAAGQLPVLASQFSTSAHRVNSLTDSFKGFQSAMKGETSVFDAQDSQTEEQHTSATTWEGLEWIGTKKWYEQQKRPQEAFKAYGPITAPLQDRMKIRNELLKAIIEVFTIGKAAPEALQDMSSQGNLERNYDFPTRIRIGCDQETNKPIFEFESEEVEKQFLEHLQQTLNTERAQEVSEARLDSENVENTTSEPAPSKVQEDKARYRHGSATESDIAADFTFADLKDQGHGKWSSISLEDLHVRFAVAKRVQQRTGIMLTDPQITHSKTAGAMFVHLWKPEKPKKLAERLMSDEELANLPNVKIADHRITIVHREREVGRWKVIEEELTDRGIPPLNRANRTSRSGKVSA